MGDLDSKREEGIIDLHGELGKFGEVQMTEGLEQTMDFAAGPELMVMRVENYMVKILAAHLSSRVENHAVVPVWNQ